MACSPQEIERKRQEALKKLARNNSSPIKLSNIPSHKSSIPHRVHHLSSSAKADVVQKHWSPYRKKPYEITKSSAKPFSSFVAQSKSPIEISGSSKPVTATIKLVSLNKFSVEMSSFCPPIVEVLKTVPSRNYKPESREWTFNLDDYDSMVVKLGNLQSQKVVVDLLPKFILKCWKDQILEKEIDLSQIDETLYQALLPFQLEGVQFGVNRNGRCLIADDMGLGKTFQALGIAHYYKRDWPLLIVTTASMRNVWEETIQRYLPSISILQIQYMASAKDYIGSSQILIVSHDLMLRCVDKIFARGFGCIIIDESHNLKNYKAKVTQSALKLCKQAKRVILLSGTPALSRPKELYPQLEMIDSHFFSSFFEYAKRYCDSHQTPFGLNTSGQSNLQELELLLRKKFMLRRKKEDVLGSLPSKTHEVVKLDLNLNRLNEEDRKRLESLSTQFSSVKSRDKHALLLTFFSETAKIKIPAVCAFVEKVLASKTKFLIFAHHHNMLDAIQKVITFKNCKYVRIDGNTSTDQRKYFIDRFQSDDNYVCALLSITSANAGITLTAAQRVVFAELHWNPSILDQAEARVHRIGQEKDVLIQYLLADGTVDDFIWTLLQKKQRILQDMGLTKESLSSVPQTLEYEPKTNNILNYVSVDVSDENLTKGKCLLEDDFMDDGLDDILCNVEF
ncbi:SWI/SNF-related matrix-associated actin-dependent regulator of chromatin subfamily A-like protein 1 isoform X1 [Euwallacea fornicatus]|uniref:SWI/SNF-related matrix-associated actin-dependent regulator of chromatin subfamily A-like protein 1 isoform X1 n=2 Tax=Euwallacea fornicatus TaxID=995702 RepID=UPI0033900DE0